MGIALQAKLQAGLEGSINVRLAAEIEDEGDLSSDERRRLGIKDELPGRRQAMCSPEPGALEVDRRQAVIRSEGMSDGAHEWYMGLLRLIHRCTLGQALEVEPGKEWSVADQASGRAQEGFVGLFNLGATCYANSVLQQLFMTPHMRHALTQVDVPVPVPELRGARAAEARLLEEQRKRKLRDEEDLRKQAQRSYQEEYSKAKQAAIKDGATSEEAEAKAREKLGPSPLERQQAEKKEKEEQEKKQKEDGKGKEDKKDGGSEAEAEGDKARAMPKLPEDLDKEVKSKAGRALDDRKRTLDGRRLVSELQRAFVWLRHSEAQAYDPTPLIESFGVLRLGHHFKHQNDASEFMLKLLDAMRPVMRVSREPALRLQADKVFGTEGSSTMSRVGCCGAQDIRDPELQFPLQLQVSADNPDVVSALHNWKRGEIISGVTCGHCGKKAEVERGNVLMRLPDTMVLGLARFGGVIKNGEYVFEKKNDRVAFPHRIDFTPFTAWAHDPESFGAGGAVSASEGEAASSQQGAGASESKEADAAGETTGAPGAPEAIWGPAGVPVSDQDEFVLSGVVVHTGTATSGHYYSFIRDRATSQWWRFDDHRVTPFNPKYLAEEAFGGKRARREWTYSGGFGKYVTVYDDEIKNALLVVYDRASITPAAQRAEAQAAIRAQTKAAKVAKEEPLFQVSSLLPAPDTHMMQQAETALANARQAVERYVSTASGRSGSLKLPASSAAAPTPVAADLVVSGPASKRQGAGEEPRKDPPSEDEVREALIEDPCSLVDDLALLPDSHEVLSTRALADEAKGELRSSNRSLSLIAQRFDASLLDFLADLARRCPKKVQPTMGKLTAGAYFGTAMRGGSRLRKQIGYVAGGMLCLAASDTRAAGGLMQQLALPPSPPGAALEAAEVFGQEEERKEDQGAGQASSGAGAADQPEGGTAAIDLDAEIEAAITAADLESDFEKDCLRSVLQSLPPPGCAPDAPVAKASTQDIQSTWLWQGLIKATSAAVRQRLQDMIMHCILSSVAPEDGSEEDRDSGKLSGWRAVRADLYRCIVVQDLQAVVDHLQKRASTAFNKERSAKERAQDKNLRVVQLTTAVENSTPLLNRKKMEVFRALHGNKVAIGEKEIQVAKSENTFPLLKKRQAAAA